MIDVNFLSLYAPLLQVFAQSGDIDEFNWPLAIFTLGSTVAVFATASIVVWQLFATWRAKMSVAREQAYQDLATEAKRSIERTAQQLERATTELTEIRQRVAEIERLMREV